MSNEDVDRIVNYTHAGKSISWIAKRIGCSERTVERVREKQGITKPRVPALTPEQVSRAESLLDDGVSYAEAARTIGCTPRALNARFPGRGWSGRQRGQHVATLKHLGQVMA
ncbi:hypothetical protein [Mycolicibacterium fortuitum]|uniref:hypothetical protein n=2 Tax=Mycolicibacterium fortuitum TaxID=1766 RepID=UPI0007EAECA2|nr:hypothetical protein [Mycolicibacterium fortuitum]OBF68447.1 hypothetical protein A5751_34065 [Mycolicibacterium fortuitum]OBF77661.1 hypothetical protein A5751_22170 [Mycolicibacterium fortuitum]